jgi:hypothetical protein
MKPFQFGIFALAVSGLASPALAEVTFIPSGSVALMSFTDDNNGETHATIIGDLGFDLQLGAGFGLSFDAVGYKDGISALARYRALTWSNDTLSVSVGEPEPGFNAFARTSFTNRFAILDQNALTYADSYLTLSDLDSGDAPRGIRIDLDTERFDLAISTHEAAIDGVDRPVSAAMAFALGADFTLSAGYEKVPGQFMGFPMDVTKTKLGLSKDFGKLEASLAAYRLEVESPFFTEDRRAYELGLDYAFNDRLSAGISVLDMPDDNRRVTSADVSYQVWKGASLVAGASKTSDKDGLFYGIGLRYDF